MSQIMKRRKKGRPSKADLARRKSSSPADQGYELRRSLRRRNVRYNFDFDDFLDEDDEDGELEVRRREKKMKLVLKLNQSRASADPPTRSRGRPAARGRYSSDDEGDEDEDVAEGEEEGEEDRAPEEEEQEEDEEDEEDDDEDGSEKKPVKKRKINGGDGREDKDYEDEEEDDPADADEDDDEERKETGKKSGSSPGEQCDRRSATPMPDKKSLELILDKLQKKDVYGVYAEPVDPEELPDYHDIIEHPMDFATVRKKLANVSYPTLEDFESDVFLICSNAMQYNAPDTVYYKQARTIQEMAKKKFEKVRIKIERSEKELKTEQKVKPSTLGKKQVKQPLSRNVLEPVGSDFASGANLASGGAVQIGSFSIQTGGFEKHSYMDGLLEGNTSLVGNLEKAEELSSGKGFLSKFGRKLSGVDENRRATYNFSNQPTGRSESIFSTFESEIKQLVAVGLHAEHAYARSLARFAATLGPSAWRVASKQIEQALPAGYKFGRGWVGEYEPLPTPVLLLETCTRKEPLMFLKTQSNAVAQKNEMPPKTSVPVKEQPSNGPASEANPFLFQTSATAVSVVTPSAVASQAGTPNSEGQQQNSRARNFAEPQNKIRRQVELNLPPSNEHNYSGFIPEKQSSDKSEKVALSRSSGMMKNMSFTQSEHSKPLAANGICPGGLPNGKFLSTGSDDRMINLSTGTANQMARAQPSSRNQGLSDLVQLARSEKAKMQQNSSSYPLNVPSHVSSVSSIRTEDSSNAAVAAARAWMSIGAGGHKIQVSENSNSPKSQISAESLYIPTRELHTQGLTPRSNSELPVSAAMQFHPQRNGFPFQTFVQQPVHGMANGAQQQLHTRPMVFPQLVPTSDFTRFQVQSFPWRGISPHVQLKQKQDNLPPDLNIGVQSPDSPAKQSSGVRVDSQQPDLALQL